MNTGNLLGQVLARCGTWAFLAIACYAFRAEAAHPLEQWETIYGVPGTRYVGLAASPHRLVVIADTEIVSWRFDALEEKTVVKTEGPLYSAAYGPQIFVATGRDGILTAGVDADKWTPADAGDATGFREVVFGNRIFLINASNMFLRSRDGITWTATERPHPGSFGQLTFAGDYFIFDTMGVVYLSQDGVNWSPASSRPQASFYSVGSLAGKYVAIGDYNTVLTSRNAMNWTEQGRLEGISRPMEQESGHGWLVAASGNARAYTQDGIRWNVIPSETHISDLLFANGYFYSAGADLVQRSRPVTQLQVLDISERAIWIAGVPDTRYRVESTDEFRGNETEWNSRHEDTLSNGYDVWRDSEPIPKMRFYRVVTDE